MIDYELHCVYNWEFYIPKNIMSSDTLPCVRLKQTKFSMEFNINLIKCVIFFAVGK